MYDKSKINLIIKDYYLFDREENLKDKLSKAIGRIDLSEEDTIFDFYNNFILKYYNGELSIKSLFFKYLMTKNLEVSIFEMPVGNSRADIVTVNGESKVYEIKTELDTYNRLESQLHDYRDHFDKVYVVVPLGEEKKVSKIIDESIGIITYSKVDSNLKVRTHKKAIKQEDKNPYNQLNSLDLKSLRSIKPELTDLNRELLIDELIRLYKPRTINSLYKKLLKMKYNKRFNFIVDNLQDINPIDLQTFFKLNINPKKIYKNR